MLIVISSILSSTLVVFLPGLMALLATGWHRRIDAQAVPAAAAVMTVLIATPLLVITMAMKTSIYSFAAMLASATIVAAVLANHRRRSLTPGERLAFRTTAITWRELGIVLVPAVLVAVFCVIDSPNVRADTWWHVTLVGKLAELDSLSSASLAFEAGTSGNANYPLPVLHALLAVAMFAPFTDAFSVSWFVTVTLAPTAMLVWGSMAAQMLGKSRLNIAGAWVYIAVMILGFGPFYMITRFMAYPGHLAGYLALPLLLLVVTYILNEQNPKQQLRPFILLSIAATIIIGVLHGNYMLYPALFVAGAAALLAVTRHDIKRALIAVSAVIGSGVATLAIQLPWLTQDDNFLRGTGDPTHEPTAFLRHRDVLTGSEDSFHVALGSLAAQPLLAIGALFLPLALYLWRRSPGPWLLAGGTLGMTIIAASPFLVHLFDAAGTITPVTRFDRVYPAAVGILVLVYLLALGTHKLRIVPRLKSQVVIPALFAVVAGATWWLDSIRNIERDLVTDYLEARWVGGLEFDGIARNAVALAGLAIVGVTVAIGVKSWRTRATQPLTNDPVQPPQSVFTHAAVLAVAVVVGLIPATLTHLEERIRPDAYASLPNNDDEITALETYPAHTIKALRRIPAGTTMLVGFPDTRIVAAHARAYSINTSLLRGIHENPPTNQAAADELLAELVDEWKPAYLAARPDDPGFKLMLKSAAQQPDKFKQVVRGRIILYRVIY